MMNKIDEFIEKYGLHVDVQTRYIDFMSDAGTVGKEILKATDYGSRPLTVTDGFKEEAGDCLFSFLALLSESGIDADELLDHVLEQYRNRIESYPG